MCGAEGSIRSSPIFWTLLLWVRFHSAEHIADRRQWALCNRRLQIQRASDTTMKLSTLHHVAISAGSWAPGRLDIFGLGTNNAMFHKSSNGAAWGPSQTGWDAIGGVFSSPPAAVSWGTDRLDVVGLGTDAGAPSTAAWEALGGAFASELAVVSGGPGALDVFGLGTDNAVWHHSWAGGAWAPPAAAWESLGGVFDPN